MDVTEEITVWFGAVERLLGDKDSSVLAQLPKGVYPDPEPACASCPGKDWYVTAKELRCYCTPRGVVCWVSNEAPVMACDTRERLIENADQRSRVDRAG